jgi:hypothetical protein
MLLHEARDEIGNVLAWSERVGQHLVLGGNSFGEHVAWRTLAG